MFKKGIQKNGGQDDREADIEGGGQVFVLVKQQARQHNAVEPLEVYGEVDGVGRQVLHEVDAGNERIDRAYAGKHDQENDVAVAQGEELRRVASFKGKENAEPDEGCTELDEAEYRRGNRLFLILDEQAVIDAEDGRGQRCQDAKKDAEAVLEFHRKDQADGADNDQADDELVQHDLPLVDERLYDGRKERTRAEGGHRYGHVGNLDGAVEAKPMNTDDKSYQRKLHQAPEGNDRACSDVYQVKPHHEYGEPNPVPYQRKRIDADALAEYGRPAPDEDNEVKQ